MTQSQIEDIYPLSPSQQGMLFDTLSASSSSKYIEFFLSDLAGVLDVAAFRQAWQAVVQRHPSLRTGFLWKDRAEPVQFVLKQVSFSIDYQDWQTFSVEEQEARQQAYVQDLLARGFPFAKPPLLHFALFHTTEQCHRFLWATHHILLDGWCIPLVLSEVLSFYTAQQTGQVCNLPTALPYRTYIHWLKRQDITAAQAFWQKYLHGFHQPTPLGQPQVAPATFDRVQGTAEQYGDCYGYLSAEATATLRALAQQQHSTMSTLIQCVWALLLHRYSGHTDVLFGATVAGRPAQIPGVESIVGLFINTIPVRLKIAQEASFPTWLADCQQQRSETEGYTYCSAGQIHGWSEVPGVLPLFQSLLVFQNYPKINIADKQIVAPLEFLPADSRGARTPYALTIIAAPATELTFHLIYDRHVLQQTDVTQILDHWLFLLQTIAERPHQLLQQLVEQVPAEQIPKVHINLQDASATSYVRSRTLIEQQLVQIWEETLGIHPIGIENNFFERGGHSLLAVRLLASIQQSFGQSLPLSALFQSPTVAALATLLQRTETMNSWSSWVAIQSTGERPSFFCAGGAGGNPLYLYALARHLSAQQPFYGLQATGLDGQTPPFTTVEAAATHYRLALQRIQPQGPYYLGGHSFGGWIAFELAQQLVRAGECVAMVAIFDSGAPASRQAEEVGDDVALMLAHADVFSERYGRDHTLTRTLLEPLTEEARLQQLQHALEGIGALPPASDLALTRGRWQVFKANIQTTYTPVDVLPVPLTLFLASDGAADTHSDREHQQMVAEWSAFAPLTWRLTPGTHVTMLAEPHVQTLAQELVRCLADGHYQ